MPTILYAGILIITGMVLGMLILSFLRLRWIVPLNGLKGQTGKGQQESRCRCCKRHQVGVPLGDSGSDNGSDTNTDIDNNNHSSNHRDVNANTNADNDSDRNYCCSYQETRTPLSKDKNENENKSNNASNNMSTGGSEHILYDNDNDNDNDEEGYEVLQGSLELFFKQFFESSHSCNVNANSNADCDFSFGSRNTINNTNTINNCSRSSSVGVNGSNGANYNERSCSSSTSGTGSGTGTISRKKRNLKTTKVVNFLSPKEMANELFNTQKSTSLSLRNNNTSSNDINDVTTSTSTSTSTFISTPNTSTTTSAQQMIQLFQQIQQYSVNTSHPYFFNQLFGTLDPVALAAEIIALSAHTSPYTYETAPVFTMIEREVMNRLGELVFERDDDYDKNLNSNLTNHVVATSDTICKRRENSSFASQSDSDDDSKSSSSSRRRRRGKVIRNEETTDCVFNDIISNKYDGLMIPGGSLSNLTAIHVARHYFLHGTHQPKQIQTQTQKQDHHHHRHHHLQQYEKQDGCNGEEKKEQCFENNNSTGYGQPESDDHDIIPSKSQLVAFVSSEAHYSFVKSAKVTGIGTENLISVPTTFDGQMDLDQLDLLLSSCHDYLSVGGRSNPNNNDNDRMHRMPFFVAATAGSTVRGSFDNINGIIQVCRKHEDIINQKLRQTYNNVMVNGCRRRKQRHLQRCKIWVHVDGAWGGSAIFSSRADMRSLLDGVQHADSFTFNPHKMLGAPQQTTAFISRHKNILKAANSSGAKYLFDCRKNGAECDLGDTTYTCGRKADSIKLWALWKYYGPHGIGQIVEKKADSLSSFVRMIQDHKSFMLACNPWPFNVNFYFLPRRIQNMLRESGVDTTSENPVIPDEISRQLAVVSVQLKLKLHQSGEMLIPYQPISNQTADCFRLVLAGKKTFTESDYRRILELMLDYGCSL